ncbi:MAG: carboxypeptidase-like regulatory domain-containing protein [Candidatus Thermoplasmatota archaeon]
MRGLLVATLMLLAGCAAANDATLPSETADFEDFDGEATATTGIIRGVVVDTTITPIAKALVSISGATKNDVETDAQGRFLVEGLEPGTYLLKSTHLLYEDAQTSVEVVANVNEPPVTKLQMEAKFTATPFHTQQKFVGYIACGYQAVLLTAPCVTDYTSILPICPGGCANELREVQGDQRAFPTTVDAGWETIVLELTFEPITQGTADQMGILLSFEMRTASDWYAQVDGPSPVILRVETGVEHETQQGDFPMVDPNGQADLTMLGSLSSSEGLGIGIQQKFELIKTDFYNAKPPEGWSFVNGDPFPF